VAPCAAPKPENRRLIRHLRQRIDAWGDADKVFANSGWLILDTLLRIALVVGLNAAMTRSLDPTEFGTLRTAMAFVGLASAFSNLGLAGILVRELARAPEDANEILGTTSVLYAAGAFSSIAMCAGLGYRLYADDLSKLLLVLILTLGVFFHPARVYDRWFQYRVRSKVAVIAKGVASVGSMVGMFVAAFLKAPVWVFAAVAVSDMVLSGIALAIVGAFRKDVPSKLTFSWTRAKYLLSESWPLVLSVVAARIYLKLDQVMIDQMLDEATVGLYAAAADVSERWYFIPTAIAASALSGMVTRLKDDREKYEAQRQDLYDLMVLMAAGIVVVVWVCAEPLMQLAYAPDPAGAAAVLRVHILACPFIFMAKVLSKAIVAEGYVRFSIVRHSAGAVVNVVLNLLLIPRYGALGAAWATLVSYAAASYFICVVHPDARQSMGQMTRSLVAPIRIFLPRRRG